MTETGLNFFSMVNSEGGSKLACDAWLPSNPDDQINVGLRIVGEAYRTKVSGLEGDLRTSKAINDDLRTQINGYQRKLEEMDEELKVVENRSTSLKGENNNLIKHIRKLQIKIEKLESVRKAVLSSIQENSADLEEDNHNITTNSESDMLYCNTSPIIITSPAHSSPGASLLHEDENSVHGSTVIGREFFRVAKRSLTYEDFQVLIGIVRKLNSTQYTKEETLERVRRVIGAQHPDIFNTFRELLKKYVPNESHAQAIQI